MTLSHQRREAQSCRRPFGSEASGAESSREKDQQLARDSFLAIPRPQRLETVETEVNWDSKRTNERVPFLISSFDLCRYKRFLCCLGYSSRPGTKYFFAHRTQYKILCPHRPASCAGSRAGSPVSLCVCLWKHLCVRKAAATAILIVKTKQLTLFAYLS